MADKESDFFERIEVSLKKYPELEKHVAEAVAAFDAQHPEACVAPLGRALQAVRQLSSSGRKSGPFHQGEAATNRLGTGLGGFSSKRWWRRTGQVAHPGNTRRFVLHSPLAQATASACL